MLIYALSEEETNRMSRALGDLFQVCEDKGYG